MAIEHPEHPPRASGDRDSSSHRERPNETGRLSAATEFREKVRHILENAQVRSVRLTEASRSTSPVSRRAPQNHDKKLSAAAAKRKSGTSLVMSQQAATMRPAHQRYAFERASRHYGCSHQCSAGFSGSPSGNAHFERLAKRKAIERLADALGSMQALILCCGSTPEPSGNRV